MEKLTADRIQTLHPKYRNNFYNFVKEAETTLKIVLRVVQAYRTFPEQDALFNQPWDHKDNDGDSKIDEGDEKVTICRGGQSLHNYGIAIDVVEMINGKPNWNFNYSKLEPIANKYGLKWGGRFKKPDKPHFEVKDYPDYEVLLAKYKAGDFIPNTHYLNL